MSMGELSIWTKLQHVPCICYQSQMDTYMILREEKRITIFKVSVSIHIPNLLISEEPYDRLPPHAVIIWNELKPS